MTLVLAMREKGAGALGLPVLRQDTWQLILKYWDRALLSVLFKHSAAIGASLSSAITALTAAQDVGKEAWNAVMPLTPHSLKLGQGLEIWKSEVWEETGFLCSH